MQQAHQDNSGIRGTSKFFKKSVVLPVGVLMEHGPDSTVETTVPDVSQVFLNPGPGHIHLEPFKCPDQFRFTFSNLIHMLEGQS